MRISESTAPALAWRHKNLCESPQKGRESTAMARKERKDESKSTSVLPMQLQVGDRFTDERGEWEVASQPFTLGRGKVVHVRVLKVGEPAVTERRGWGAHEKVAVRRG